VAMSYFNEEQQAYMRELAAMPAESKCDCGWYRRGQCQNCRPERGGRRSDPACEHGTAMDVHCCNCHGGFLFDSDSCVCKFEVEG
jgi:hypothetical protein